MCVLICNLLPMIRPLRYYCLLLYTAHCYLPFEAAIDTKIHICFVLCIIQTKAVLAVNCTWYQSCFLLFVCLFLSEHLYIIWTKGVLAINCTDTYRMFPAIFVCLFLLDGAFVQHRMEDIIHHQEKRIANLVHGHHCCLLG